MRLQGKLIVGDKEVVPSQHAGTEGVYVCLLQGVSKMMSNNYAGS